MLLPAVAASPGASALPQWPPLIAARGPGTRSEPHSHHAMHFILPVQGTLKFRTQGASSWRDAAGVLTRPDAVHSVDARGIEVLLVFLDPESDVGSALSAQLAEPLRALTEGERGFLIAEADPRGIVREGGAAWTARALAALGGQAPGPARPIHPRVRRLLRVLRSGVTDETSLERLAEQVGISPSRLMHVFTESIGVPLRPYLAWLRLQRAASAIVEGAPLALAAQSAGFSDAAHMSRTFRRMFGVTPSALRPPRV
jgi:AraC-like DNA-binding protein